MRYIRRMLAVVSLAISLGLLFVCPWSRTPAWAVPGEKHYVGSVFALVREAPYSAAGIVATIPAGQAVVEISRQQNWLEVGVVRQGVTGWIHLSFLGVQEDARRRPEPLIPPMRKFRAAFDTLNTTMMRAGFDTPPFTSVSDRGKGALLVLATHAWWAHSPARKQNDLASLYQMWKVANERLPVSVVISDPTGQRRLQRIDKGAVQP